VIGGGSLRKRLDKDKIECCEVVSSKNSILLGKYLKSSPSEEFKELLLGIYCSINWRKIQRQKPTA